MPLYYIQAKICTHTFVCRVVSLYLLSFLDVVSVVVRRLRDPRGGRHLKFDKLIIKHAQLQGQMKQSLVL